MVEAVRIVAQRSHVVLDGDQALLELGARRAAHFDQLVGPYSRVGFHQPGPVVFYLLAPFVRILEPSGPGLYLGAIAISGAALIATVAFLWRHLGPVAALWAAIAIDVYCLCLRVGTLREPWNPYLVVAPMVLFVVLWAAAITGSSGAGVWAVVIGSYEIQTHIATAGFVITMWAILAAWAVAGPGAVMASAPPVVTGGVRPGSPVWWRWHSCGCHRWSSSGGTDPTTSASCGTSSPRHRPRHPSPSRCGRPPMH